jgi:hypothetical protein
MEFKVTLFLKKAFDDKKEIKLSFTDESYETNFIPFISGKASLYAVNQEFTRDDIVAHSTIQISNIDKTSKKVIAYPTSKSSAVH